jgi:dTMP kinase
MGKLIVIDGLDGSGKTTQFELIQKELSDRGIVVKAISFPEYDKPSSTLVKMYLGGEFSKNAEDVNAYASSSFYAVDRYASYKLYWEKDYLDDKLILASRYVSSNAIHQMVKLPEGEWEKYLEWLIDYEHVKMDIPKADKIIFLDMPIEISQKLLSRRYNGDENKKDIHESNVEYLYKCRKSALFAAEKLGWSVVTCNDGENPLTTEEISNKIMKIIDEVI